MKLTELYELLDEISNGRCGVNRWVNAWEKFSGNKDTYQMIDVLASYALGLVCKGEEKRAAQISSMISAVVERENTKVDV